MSDEKIKDVTTDDAQPRPQIGVRFDDDFTSVTTDVARVWFTVGKKPEDTASLAVMVRSVGHNNKAQLGMHEIACQAVRKAIEAAFAPDHVLGVWTEVAKEPTDAH